MPNITLADVAREAGVTPSTVSRVLNSKKGRVPISEATIRRVQEAAEKLGYVPSATARALRTGRLRSIGVLGADPNAYLEMERGGFMTEIFAGITAAAIRHGYHVSLLTGWDLAANPGRQLMDLGLIDGLLLVDLDLEAEGDLEEALGRWPKPVVHALEYPRDSAHACRVGPDDGSGGRLAARYLLERGHKRIGFVRWPDHSRIYRKRYEGYRAELEAWGHESEAVAFELLRDADRLKASGCTGFVCGNEVIAAQVKHLFAGAEVVATGYLDRENKPAWKDFAVVGHPLALCMEKAVDLLIERVEHGGDDAKEVTTAYRVCPPEGSGSS